MDGYGLSDNLYAKGYTLRKSLSTMTDNTLAWFSMNSERLIDAPAKYPRKVLSIGCGDGELDLALLKTFSKYDRIDYVGWDQNAHEMSLFQHRFDLVKNRLARQVTIQLESQLFTEQSVFDEQFDVILMSHMLYYFKNPKNILKHAIHLLSKTGKLVIVQQCNEGIPSIRHQLQSKLGIGSKPQPSELIKQILEREGIRFSSFRVNAELDINTLFEKEKQDEARLLMSFCIGENLNLFPRDTVEIVSEMFKVASVRFNNKSQPVIREPVDIIVVNSLMNLPPAVSMAQSIRPL